MRTCALVPLVLAMLCGCNGKLREQPGKDAPQRVRVEIVKAAEHLGHDTTVAGEHAVWCDGCRARVVGTGEPFVIYWINNQIKNTPFRFSEGRKYAVWFTGEVGTGVMAYQGKCIDIGQIVRVEGE
ncbi:hypothetical protein HQ560_01195 [bacterium]|nr:hypothetical protein [bacterium]